MFRHLIVRSRLFSIVLASMVISTHGPSVQPAATSIMTLILAQTMTPGLGQPSLNRKDTRSSEIGCGTQLVAVEQCCPTYFSYLSSRNHKTN
jgi:hypothetical protein